MRTLIRIGLLLGIVPGLAAAEVRDHLPEAERGTAWFSPSLTVDARPICAEVLEAERDKFFAPAEPPVAPAGLIKIVAGQDAVAPDPSAVLMEGYLPQIMLTLPDKTRAYIHYTRNPGCGGGCETHNVIVSRQPVAADQMESPREQQSPRATPASPEWLLYKADGEFYVWGELQEHARVYRIASADSLELACDVLLRPTSVPLPPALDQFLAATNELAPVGGDCGSMGTHWRWRSVRGEALHESLYRPWGIGHRWPGFSASIHVHDAIETNLRRWSLGGLMEYRAFIAHEQSVAPALVALANIYAERFGWPPDRSMEMAEAALAATMSVSFGFYMYEPYAAKGEMWLRKAILSHAAIADFREIDIDVEAIDRANEDSVLNVAIEYPAALSYLLSKGFDPNTANAFGKTPLMYAAQYNQLESAKLLLAAGADPNAATVRPSDSCAYRMSSSGVTPVHYAVRYASAAMIELLLGNGAVSFSRAENDGATEYPLDRARMYLGVAATKGRNPLVEDEDAILLPQKLKVPSDAERKQAATTYLARARSEYAQGNSERAYQHMRVVLLADPGNSGALADLPLMALKAGYIGPAMSAAQHATDTFKEPSALAAAWFNKGLVCEHPAAREMFYFNEARCDHDVVEPFIKALRLQPTRARASKLTALFKEGGGACLLAKGPRSKAYLITRHRDGNGQRIYMLHSSSETIDPKLIEWRLDAGGAMTLPTYPQVSDRLALGDRTLTMLDHGRHGEQLIIDGQACKETQ